MSASIFKHYTISNWVDYSEVDKPVVLADYSEELLLTVMGGHTVRVTTKMLNDDSGNGTETREYLNPIP